MSVAITESHSLTSQVRTRSPEEPGSAGAAPWLQVGTHHSQCTALTCLPTAHLPLPQEPEGLCRLRESTEGRSHSALSGTHLREWLPVGSVPRQRQRQLLAPRSCGLAWVPLVTVLRRLIALLSHKSPDNFLFKNVKINFKNTIIQYCAFKVPLSQRRQVRAGGLRHGLSVPRGLAQAPVPECLPKRRRQQPWATGV